MAKPKDPDATAEGTATPRQRISPWPDRLALIGIWLAGIVITILYQRPKEAGLYADFWFGALITLGLVMVYALGKRWLGLPPVTLKLKRQKRRPQA